MYSGSSSLEIQFPYTSPFLCFNELLLPGFLIPSAKLIDVSGDMLYSKIFFLAFSLYSFQYLFLSQCLI